VETGAAQSNRITGEQVVFAFAMGVLFACILLFLHSAIRRQFLTEKGRTTWYTGLATWGVILFISVSVWVIAYLCWFYLGGFGMRSEVQNWLVAHGISIR
jgi:hypothetical protein